MPTNSAIALNDDRVHDLQYYYMQYCSITSLLLFFIITVIDDKSLSEKNLQNGVTAELCALCSSYVLSIVQE